MAERLLAAYRRACAESEQLRRDRNALAMAWDDLAMGTGKMSDTDYIRALYVRNSIVAGLPVLDPGKEGDKLSP